MVSRRLGTFTLQRRFRFPVHHGLSRDSLFFALYSWFVLCMFPCFGALSSRLLLAIWKHIVRYYCPLVTISLYLNICYLGCILWLNLDGKMCVHSFFMQLDWFSNILHLVLVLEKPGWDLLYILIGLQVKNLEFLFYKLYFFKIFYYLWQQKTVTNTVTMTIFVIVLNSLNDSHRSLFVMF